MSDWPETYPDPRPPVRIWQHPDEFGEFLEFYKELKPHNILEIGSESGGTLWYWIQFAPPDSTIITCDLRMQASETSVYGHDHWPLWAAEKGVRLTIANMLSSNTYDLTSVIKQWCPDGLDFSFIDGSHDYGNASRDFQLCWDLTKVGGAVCLHDIAFPHIKDASEVDVLWAELKEKYRTREIIRPCPNGIGIVFKDK